MKIFIENLFFHGENNFNSQKHVTPKPCQPEEKIRKADSSTKAMFFFTKPFNGNV